MRRRWRCAPGWRAAAAFCNTHSLRALPSPQALPGTLTLVATATGDIVAVRNFEDIDVSALTSALTITGLMLATLAMGYGAWVVAEYFFWGIDVPGYATLVVGMMFFSGIQLLSIGVLAEYVGRIYEEVKQRPMYLVSKRWGSGLGIAPVKLVAPEVIDNDPPTPV